MVESETPLPKPMPAGMTLDHTATGLEISYRWFSIKFVFLALFCLFWEGFLILWYSQALGNPSDMLPVLFPLFHVVVGLGLTYYTAAGFVNRTVVTISPGEITVQHLPLPWFGSRIVQSSMVTQLYVEEVVHRGRHGTHVTYRLSAIAQDNRKIKLVTGLESREVAEFLEQEMEGYLRIKDQPVRGEAGSA